MAFRDQVVAAQAQVEKLQAALHDAEHRAEAAETRTRSLETELDSLRHGVSLERLLRGDPHFSVAQVLLPVAGLLGGMASIVVVATVMRPAFHGHFDPSPRGISNFFGQLDSVETLGATLLLVVALLFTLLPLVAAFGLVRRRKWGWSVAVVSFAVWALPCPPLGLYGLFGLCRRSIRLAFFGPSWEEMAEEPMPSVREDRRAEPLDSLDPSNRA